MLETCSPSSGRWSSTTPRRPAPTPASDRIIEIACLKVHPDGRREQWIRRLNPGIPIPPASTAIHGISDADVADAPRFRDVAAELAAFLAGCDLAGYNIAGFDLPVLRAEFLRAGVPFEISDRRLVDAQRIFFSREPRHLAAAARFYCQAEHDGRARRARRRRDDAARARGPARCAMRSCRGPSSELHEQFCAGHRSGHRSRGPVPARQRRADGQLRKEPRTRS